MNCSALSAHLIFGKRAASRCQKRKKNTGQSKDFAFLNVPAYVRDEIIKLDGIEYKNQIIKIEKARAPYLSKPRKATIRPSPVVNNNPEN